jgi:hypothetical protein
MVMALMVTFVVLLLGVAVISMAIHNSEQSGLDRKRVQSVSAAEAGLNAAYAYLTKPPGGLAAMSRTLSGTVGSGPGGSTYDVTLTYYEDEEGTKPISPPFSSAHYPRSVFISSVGESNGRAPRTMQTFVELAPVIAGFDGAVVSNSSATFSNRFTINGYLGNDGNVYVLDGNFSAPSGLETIKGNIYVPKGSASLATQVHVYGTVWAKDSVTLDHPQVRVDGDLKSSESSISVIRGSVGGKGYYCKPPPIGYTMIAGGTQQTCTGPPPSQEFPQIKYVPSDWENNDPPYTIRQFTTCESARDYILNTGTYAGTGFSGRDVGAEVVYINNSTCILDLTAPGFPQNQTRTITLKNNLAIITRGGVSLSQKTYWQGESGTKYLHIISAYPDSGSPSCPTQDVLIGQNTDFDSHVSAIVYSPCTVTMANNNTAFQGQVIGRNVVIGNNFTMNYLPVKVPGQNIVGFEQDIAYIREVVS